MKLRKMTLAVLPLFLLLLLALAPQAALAADGTVGDIKFDVTSVVENTLLSVRFYNLATSSDYWINHTGDSTGTAYSTSDDQTEIYIPIKITMPATGNTFTIMLLNSTYTLLIDSQSLFVSPYSAYLDEDQYIDLGIPILIIVIFAGIIVTLIAAFKFK